MDDSNSEQKSVDDLRSTVAQLTKLVAMQSKQMQAFVKMNEEAKAAASVDSRSELMESLSNRIGMFNYDVRAVIPLTLGTAYMLIFLRTTVKRSPMPAAHGCYVIV